MARHKGIFVSPDGLWVGFFDGNTSDQESVDHGWAARDRVRDWTRRARRRHVGTGRDHHLRDERTGDEDCSACPPPEASPRRSRRSIARAGKATTLWPEFLPGGEAVLFTIVPPTGSIDNAQVAVLDLRTGTSKVLIRGGSHARYVPTGHLVYGVSGTLRAVAIRPRTAGSGRDACAGAGGRGDDGLGAADIAVAANGSLVYVAGGAVGGSRQTVVSVDRQGRSSPLPGLPLDAYRTVRVSPDGTRLALATEDDVSIYDFARATLSRLTTDPTHDTSPLWTPDSQRIVFTSTRAGYPELFVRRADGTGSDERLLGRAKDLLDLLPDGWSKDGKQLLFSEVTPSLQCAIGQIAFERPSDVKLLVKNDSCNIFATVSPDGRWIAYTSNVSGRVEIYVERYPELGNRQQISTGGGDVAAWSRDGRELFFNSPDGRQMFAVPMQSGTTLVAGRPQVLFESAMPPSGGGYRRL